MRPIDGSLKPDERLSEIAGIFAAGILRLSARAALAGGVSQETPPNSSSSCLEVPLETVLSVDTRVNGFREPQTRRDG